MRIKDFLRKFPDYRVTASQVAYARYVERECESQRFLIDFGFENAEEIAWQHLEDGDYLLGHA